MKCIIVLKKLLLLSYFTITGVCYAQQDNNYFSKFPAKTVFSISETVGSFKQIVCEVPEGTNDTVWTNCLLTPPMWKFQANMEDENVDFVNEYEDRLFFVNASNISDAVTIKKHENKLVVLKNTSYPLNALKKGKEGKVEATCIVEEDGSLTNIKITKCIYPSIDEEALRLLSGVKLTPGKVGTKAIRTRHNISLLFEIKKKDSKKKHGRVLVVEPTLLPEGVDKVFRHGVQWSETMTHKETDKYGADIYKYSKTLGSWITSLEIDVPEDNPDFEKILCNRLYNFSGGISIEGLGPKFAKYFQGKIRNKDFKDKKGNFVSIIAKCLAYKSDKYYSYGYETTLKTNASNKDGHSVTHNIIYDIQAKKILNITDVLTKDEIMAMGLNAKESYDLGLDKHYLYIGKNRTNIVTIGISQENWYKFPSTFQSLLGDERLYPVNKSNYAYGGMFGIQALNVMQQIVNIPSFKVKENVQKYIDDNLKIPTGILENREMITSVLSFIIEKDGTISNVEITQADGGTELRDEFVRIITTMPKCQPLVLSGDGAVRTYVTFKYNNSGFF